MLPHNQAVLAEEGRHVGPLAVIGQQPTHVGMPETLTNVVRVKVGVGVGVVTGMVGGPV